MPEIKKRVENVRNTRAGSSREATRKLATFPTLFGEIRQPDSDFILIPRVSSENRKYIPMGFFDKNYIVGDTCLSIPNATIFHFGILNSEMHMTWVKYTCGRLKSDYRYSGEIVYNNYPLPFEPSEKNVKRVEAAAQKVLDIREEFPDSTLANLYNPLTMPPKLVKAHQSLDKVVDLCYRSQSFKNELDRMEYLFELYTKKAREARGQELTHLTTPMPNV